MESNWALGVTYVKWKVATPPPSSLKVLLQRLERMLPLSPLSFSLSL